MPLKDWTLRVNDIFEAADRIRRFTTGMTFESFLADERTIDAVIRNIEIVGEAIRYIPEDIQQRHAAIAWRRIRAMRNVLIHQYDEVRLRTVWDATQTGLPLLVSQLQALLEQEASGAAESDANQER